MAQFPSSPLAPSEASSDTSSESGDEGHTPSCRVCAGPHDDTACPSLSMNGGQGQGTQAADASGGDAATSASDPASYEETVVRIKDLKDLVLPLPPENAGQARGYVNQVLMAIGRLQRRPVTSSISGLRIA